MICQQCHQSFPHRKGRYCGTCLPSTPRAPHYRVFVRHDKPSPPRREIVLDVNIDVRSRPDGLGYFVTLYSDGSSRVSDTNDQDVPPGARRNALIAAARTQPVEPYP
jgi:hypothetical protein